MALLASLLPLLLLLLLLGGSAAVAEQSIAVPSDGLTYTDPVPHTSATNFTGRLDPAKTLHIANLQTVALFVNVQLSHGSSIIITNVTATGGGIIVRPERLDASCNSGSTNSDLVRISITKCTVTHFSQLNQSGAHSHPLYAGIALLDAVVCTGALSNAIRPLLDINITDNNVTIDIGMHCWFNPTFGNLSTSVIAILPFRFYAQHAIRNATVERALVYALNAVSNAIHYDSSGCMNRNITASGIRVGSEKQNLTILSPVFVNRSISRFSDPTTPPPSFTITRNNIFAIALTVRGIHIQSPMRGPTGLMADEVVQFNDARQRLWSAAIAVDVAENLVVISSALHVTALEVDLAGSKIARFAVSVSDNNFTVDSFWDSFPYNNSLYDVPVSHEAEWGLLAFGAKVTGADCNDTFVFFHDVFATWEPYMLDEPEQSTTNVRFVSVRNSKNVGLVHVDRARFHFPTPLAVNLPHPLQQRCLELFANTKMHAVVLERSNITIALHTQGHCFVVAALRCAAIGSLRASRNAVRIRYQGGKFGFFRINKTAVSTTVDIARNTIDVVAGATLYLIDCSSLDRPIGKLDLSWASVTSLFVTHNSVTFVLSDVTSGNDATNIGATLLSGSELNVSSAVVSSNVVSFTRFTKSYFIAGYMFQRELRVHGNNFTVSGAADVIFLTCDMFISSSVPLHLVTISGNHMDMQATSSASFVLISPMAFKKRFKSGAGPAGGGTSAAVVDFERTLPSSINLTLARNSVRLRAAVAVNVLMVIGLRVPRVTLESETYDARNTPIQGDVGTAVRESFGIPPAFGAVLKALGLVSDVAPAVRLTVLTKTVIENFTAASLHTGPCSTLNGATISDKVWHRESSHEFPRLVDAPKYIQLAIPPQVNGTIWLYFGSGAVEAVDAVHFGECAQTPSLSLLESATLTTPHTLTISRALTPGPTRTLSATHALVPPPPQTERDIVPSAVVATTAAISVVSGRASGAAMAMNRALDVLSIASCAASLGSSVHRLDFSKNPFMASLGAAPFATHRSAAALNILFCLACLALVAAVAFCASRYGKRSFVAACRRLRVPGVAQVPMVVFMPGSVFAAASIATALTARSAFPTLQVDLDAFLVVFAACVGIVLPLGAYFAACNRAESSSEKLVDLEKQRERDDARKKRQEEQQQQQQHQPTSFFAPVIRLWKFATEQTKEWKGSKLVDHAGFFFDNCDRKTDAEGFLSRLAVSFGFFDYFVAVLTAIAGGVADACQSHGCCVGASVLAFVPSLVHVTVIFKLRPHLIRFERYALSALSVVSAVGALFSVIVVAMNGAPDFAVIAKVATAFGAIAATIANVSNVFALLSAALPIFDAAKEMLRKRRRGGDYDDDDSQFLARSNIQSHRFDVDPRAITSDDDWLHHVMVAASPEGRKLQRQQQARDEAQRRQHEAQQQRELDRWRRIHGPVLLGYDSPPRDQRLSPHEQWHRDVNGLRSQQQYQQSPRSSRADDYSMHRRPSASPQRGSSRDPRQQQLHSQTDRRDSRFGSPQRQQPQQRNDDQYQQQRRYESPSSSRRHAAAAVAAAAAATDHHQQRRRHQSPRRGDDRQSHQQHRPSAEAARFDTIAEHQDRRGAMPWQRTSREQQQQQQQQPHRQTHQQRQAHVRGSSSVPRAPSHHNTNRSRQQRFSDI